MHPFVLKYRKRRVNAEETCSHFNGVKTVFGLKTKWHLRSHNLRVSVSIIYTNRDNIFCLIRTLLMSKTNTICGFRTRFVFCVGHNLCLGNNICDFRTLFAF